MRAGRLLPLHDIKLNLYRGQSGYLLSPAIMMLPTEAEQRYSPVRLLGIIDSTVLSDELRRQVLPLVFARNLASIAGMSDAGMPASPADGKRRGIGINYVPKARR